MTTKECLKLLLSGALVLAMTAGASRTAAAQAGAAPAVGTTRVENQQGPIAAADLDDTRGRTWDQLRDQTPDQVRNQIQDRIRRSQNLTAAERTTMEGNLEACMRAGVTDPRLEAVFPGGITTRQVSTRTMLQMQARLRAMAQDGLPVEPALAKVREAQMKGVPEAGQAQVSERVEQHVRQAKQLMARAEADGVPPAPDARHERQMISELAQQMWRGTTPEDLDGLCTQARDRLRARTCTMQDLVAASETATRLREEGVPASRSIRVTGEALQQGYGAQEMRRLQYMMVYRHREGRTVKGLVDDFEHCLGSGMDSGHMYQYMMQHGWMGPGDVQGPGGSRPIDDQGHGRGAPGGGTGKGSGAGGPKRGQ